MAIHIRPAGSGRECITPPRASRHPLVTFTVVAAVAGISACQDSAAIATAPDPTFPSTISAAVTGDGLYEIRSSLAPDKCLSVRGGSIVEAARMELSTCDGGADQRFRFRDDGTIRITDALCVDAHERRPKDGDPIGLWACRGNRSQSWSQTETGQLRDSNGKCVDVWGSVGNEGQSVVAWTCHTGSGQRWDPRSVTTPPPTDPTPPPDSSSSPPPGGGGACRLVGDHVMRAQPAWPRPGYLAGAADPTYGTLVTRVTGDPGTALGALGPAWQQVNRHNYSKDPAWNADESLLLLKRVLGVGSVLLDGQTYRPLQLVGGGPGETRWHPTLPGVMIYQSAACRAGHWNPRTGAATVLYDASAGYSGCDFGPYEGNASRDGRHVAMHGTRRADGRAVAFVVDLTTGQRWPDVDLAAAGVTSVDWVSVSAGGAYLVVNGGFPGAATCCGGATDGTKVFARDGRLVQTWSEYGRPSHYDLAIDVAGNEVAVGVSKAAPDEGKVIMRRLDTGAATALTAGGYASHTSARNTGRPGWAYVTHTYNGPSWAPYRDEVFAVRLDGTQTIERLANLHTLNSTDYEGQSHAVPSPSGRRVLFASDWESGTNRPVHAYVADARPLCQ